MAGKINKKLYSKRVKELLEKDMITDAQNATLIGMIESPDLENFSVVESVLKQMIQEKLAEGLNEGQDKAYNKILDFIIDHTHADALILKGYAGTGKTYLVNKIIEYIVQTHPTRRIAIAAPTNKAVSVLYKNSANSSVSDAGYIFEDLFDSKNRLVYTTVHKLLGLKEIIFDNGERKFEVDKRNESAITDYDYLIVDEVSMLDDQICRDILKYSSKIPIIFMGDPAQIPPINRLYTIPFSENSGYNFDVVELTEIMRQKADNPIIESSFILRNNLTVEQPILKLSTRINSDGEGIVYFDAKTDKPKIRPLLQEYFKSPEFTKDNDYMKVIAWRNKSLNYINKVVRKILFGENSPTYVVGERLIVNKPVFKRVLGRVRGRPAFLWKLLFTTSEELEILSIDIISKTFTEGIHKIDLSIYELDVIAKNPSGDVHETIEVIHEESRPDYLILLAKAKKLAVDTRQATFWIQYYNILKWSADITYNYGISAHKSQGSTYKNVLLLESDIDANKNILERNRIKYTAYTRASEKLFILR